MDKASIIRAVIDQHITELSSRTIAGPVAVCQSALNSPAGLPAYIPLTFTGFVTTLPAPITAPLQISVVKIVYGICFYALIFT